MQEFPKHVVKKPRGDVGQLGRGEALDTGQPILSEIQRAWGTNELNQHQALQKYLIVAVGKASVDISSRLHFLLVSFFLQGTLKETKCVFNKKKKNSTEYPHS